MEQTLTVREQAQQKVDNHAQWLEANPALGGLDEFISWVSQEYSKDDPKIYIEKELLNSPAYRSLRRIAMLVYQDFLGKRFMKPVRKIKRGFGLRYFSISILHQGHNLPNVCIWATLRNLGD